MIIEMFCSENFFFSELLRCVGMRGCLGEAAQLASSYISCKECMFAKFLVGRVGMVRTEKLVYYHGPFGRTSYIVCPLSSHLVRKLLRGNRF